MDAVSAASGRSCRLIVECPRCSARYRVEDEVLRDEPTFKCSRCSHIFSYDGDAPLADAPPRPPSRAAASGSSESLSFAFTTGHATRRHELQDIETDDAGEEHSRRDEPEEEESDATADDDSSLREAGDDVDFVFDDDRREEPTTEEEANQDEEEPTDEDEEIDEPEDEPRRADDQPRFVRGEDELRIEPDEPDRSSARPWLAFLVVVAIFWANLALYLRNHPSEAMAGLSSIPVMGHWLSEDRLLQMRIHLQDVEGTWESIRDGRSVFIVTGRALNTSQQPLKSIQIESTLLGDEGRLLDAKNIFCGNAMSLRIVKDLSSKEISLLQRLEPPQRFEIRPGDSAAFTVVFMEPPEGLREFTARIVTAQRAAT